MEYGERHTLYATSGQFTKLDGTSYIGPYHIMEQGLPMTEATHTPDSVVLGSGVAKDDVCLVCVS